MPYLFKILILNGPNINLLGKREPHIYGDISLKDIILKLNKSAKQLNVQIEHFQSNAEHKIIDRIHQAKENNIQYIIINPAAFSHTSIALRDALLAINIPFIEVHISNIFSRENFRRHSWLSDISNGVITGLGTDAYLWALKTSVKRLLLKKNK